MKLQLLPITAGVLLANSADAFTITKSNGSHHQGLHLSKNGHDVEPEEVLVPTTTSSRRDLFTKSCSMLGTIALGTGLVLPNNINPNDVAMAYPQEKADKENIVKGYKRLTYLIDNWEKETTFCGRGDNPYIGCERNPEKVMEYLGYKSMNDPLFRSDKMLMRLETIAPDDMGIEFIDTMDAYNQSSEAGSGIAFVSSWGEANPGGGKDRIEFFIERSRKNLVECRDSLGTVINILGLSVD